MLDGEVGTGAVAAVEQVTPTLKTMLFGNVDAVYERATGGRFADGALDMFLLGTIDEYWSGLAELVFENDGNDLVVDLERYQIAFARYPWLRISAGRSHSPLIQWNSDQHHSVYLQTTVGKPTISNWEDEPGLWPVHFVGVTVDGVVVPEIDLRYSIGVGNGRGAIPDEIQAGFDRNRGKAVLAQIGAAPVALDGLDVAATGYFDTVPAASGQLRELDYTLSAKYVAQGLEVRAEFSEMTHEPLAGGVAFRTWGYYGLLSYNLRAVFDGLRPYAMYDVLNVDEREVARPGAFFADAADMNSVVAGLRLDVAPQVALKVQYRRSGETLADGQDVGEAQVAFGF